jgi:hypothetical protein
MASHRDDPGSHPGRMWGLWWTKRHWGRFSQSTSIFPANHSTNFFTIIITRGWHNRPICNRTIEWTPPSLHQFNFNITNRTPFLVCNILRNQNQFYQTLNYKHTYVFLAYPCIIIVTSTLLSLEKANGYPGCERSEVSV